MRSPRIACELSEGRREVRATIRRRPVAAERIAQLAARLDGLNGKYTDQHPLVQAARADRRRPGRLRLAVQGQQTPRPGGVSRLKPVEAAQLSKQMADLEVEVISLRSQENGVQARIARVKKSMGSMGAKGAGIRRVGTDGGDQAKLTDRSPRR